ncbi:MAG: S24 family peptidase [Phycisphaerae bacterium]
MPKSPKPEICRRIAQIRTELIGRRGKSAFARMLGLSPSTYDYYESTRIPPADVLVRMAETAGVDLRWLLTGEEAVGRGVSAEHPVLQRAAALLADHPDAARPLASFLDILSETVSQFPDAGGLDSPQHPSGEPTAPDTDDPMRARSEWIPLLGRSAAGVPQFWDPKEPPDGLTTLRELVEKNVGSSPRQVRPGLAETEQNGDIAGVQIITLNRPSEEGTAEFVVAGDIKRRYPDAFAVRIDGDSMAPDIRHGDVLVLSPSARAVEGECAVAQLSGQIGVTCKLFRKRGEYVHLVPVNEQYEPTVVPASQVCWALRVLARIRIPG